MIELTIDSTAFATTHASYLNGACGAISHTGCDQHQSSTGFNLASTLPAGPRMIFR